MKNKSKKKNTGGFPKNVKPKKCKHCGKTYKNLASHITRTHRNQKDEQLKAIDNLGIPIRGKKPKRDKTKKSTRGRKWFDGKDEEIVIGKIETAIKMGTTNKRACLYAGISEDSFYNYCKEHPEFSDRLALLKENVFLVAETQLFNSVFEGNMEDVRYLLSRRDKARYSQQLEVLNDNTNVLSKERMEKIKQASQNFSKAIIKNIKLPNEPAVDKEN